MPIGVTPNQVYQLYEHKRTGTDDVTLRGPKLDPGEVVEVHGLVLINVDTYKKKMRLGYNDGRRDIWLRRRSGETGQYAMWLETLLSLREGQQLIGMVESPDNKDDVYLLATGYIVSEVGV